MTDEHEGADRAPVDAHAVLLDGLDGVIALYAAAAELFLEVAQSLDAAAEGQLTRLDAMAVATSCRNASASFGPAAAAVNDLIATLQRPTDTPDEG